MIKRRPTDRHALRRSAEEAVNSQAVATNAVSEFLNDKRMLLELQVHKIELDMQNEELQQTIQVLEEHELHLRNIIKNSPAGYFHINLEGQFVEVNDAWLRIHGYDSPDEVIGKHFGITQVESELAAALKHVADLHRGLAVPTGEFTHLCKDGSVGYHTFSAHPVVNSGKVVGLEWFIIDTSDRKRVEDEKLVLQHQFLQAQKLESLGVLAGGIAHDFNNILAIIMGYCSLIKLDVDTAAVRIPAIEIAAERAAGLCRQMLTYAGKGRYVLTPTNIGTLVEEMVNMLNTTIKQNIVIKPYLPVDIPCINGDANQIRQIVMNLIINASEAIGDGQGEVLVSLTQTEIKDGQQYTDHAGKIIQSGWYVCLEVVDNGCGMNEETMRRIFEPFYTTKFTGRGLGMAAVKGIITAHSGVLQLFSQPGQGTTFRVYLPVHSTESVAEEKAIFSVPWRGSGTILLVEDEDQIRMISKSLLQSMGFTVIDASNGKDALAMYQHNITAITLIVTDIGMPVMNGYEMIREIKKLNPGLPIIITSGFGDDDVTSQIARKDVAWLISKPYNYDQLQNALKSVVEEKACQNIS
jgi:PAS domain S-box-containing protein